MGSYAADNVNPVSPATAFELAPRAYITCRLRMPAKQGGYSVPFLGPQLRDLTARASIPNSAALEKQCLQIKATCARAKQRTSGANPRHF